jgi:hypothetical protein
MMLEITDIAYQGGGMVVAFNDNTTAVAVYKTVNGRLTLEGLTPEQEAALELFNDAANVDRLVADPRTNLIFGDDFQYVVDESMSTLTGTSGFRVKLEMTTPVLSGIYLLQWNMQGKVEGPNVPSDGRIEMKCREIDMDNPTVGNIDLGFHQALNITPANGGPLENIFSGHKVIIFDNELKKFDLVYRTKDNGDTATVCRARLVLWRLR